MSRKKSPQNEMTQMWKDIRKNTQQRHKNNHEANRQIIDKSGIPYTDRGETLLFRQPEKPKVDFYPSTGRWRIAGGNKKTFAGGAQAFLSWYRKQ